MLPSSEIESLRTYEQRYAECVAGGFLQNTKETVRALLDRLPDDCSLDDVLYHLYAAQAVAQGRADVEAGRTIPHEQVAEELRRKWLAGCER